MGMCNMSKLNTDLLSGPSLEQEGAQEQAAVDEVNGPGVENVQAEEHFTITQLPQQE